MIVCPECGAAMLELPPIRDDRLRGPRVLYPFRCPNCEHREEYRERPL